MRLLRRLLRLFQQDRIRASREPHALLRMGPDDWLTIGDEDFVVYSAGSARAGAGGGEVRVYGLGRDGAPVAKLLVAIASPDRAWLIAERPGFADGLSEAIPTATIVLYGHARAPP